MKGCLLREVLRGPVGHSCRFLVNLARLRPEDILLLGSCGARASQGHPSSALFGASAITPHSNSRPQCITELSPWPTASSYFENVNITSNWEGSIEFFSEFHAVILADVSGCWCEGYCCECGSLHLFLGKNREEVVLNPEAGNLGFSEVIHLLYNRQISSIIPAPGIYTDSRKTEFPT